MKGDPIVRRDDLGIGIVLVPDPLGCGMGLRERCCAYLVVGAGGYQCARDTTVRITIDERVAAGTMTSIRQPSKPLFDCQLEPEEGPDI